jgi:hypothetical protein
LAIVRETPAKRAGRKEIGNAATAAWLILRLMGRARSSNSGRIVPSAQPTTGSRPLLPRAGSPLLCADAPRHLRCPSSPAESTKRLKHQILKLNGFSKPYCQIKWIFPSITAPIKRLILLKANSHAKMAPDSGLIFDPASARVCALKFLHRLPPSIARRSGSDLEAIRTVKEILHISAPTASGFSLMSRSQSILTTSKGNSPSV